MTLTALAMLGSIASTAGATIMSARKRNEAQAIENAQSAEAQNLLRSRINSDITKDSQFRAILQSQKELADKQYRREIGVNQVIGGDSTRAYAQKQANATERAKTYSGLAQYATSQKRADETALMAEKRRNASQRADFADKTAQNIAQAGTQASTSMGNLAAAGADDETDVLKMFGLRKA